MRGSPTAAAHTDEPRRRQRRRGSALLGRRTTAGLGLLGAALLLALLLTAAHGQRLLALPNAWLLEQLQSLGGTPARQHPVAVVKLPPLAVLRDAVRWQALVDALQAQGARRIVLTALPAQPAVLAALAREPTLLFAVNTEAQYAALLAAGVGAGQIVSNRTPESTGAYVRSQRGRPPRAAMPPTLERRLAGDYAPDIALPRSGAFPIRYGRRAAGIALLRGSRVLAGDAAPVAGRIVLVGRDLLPDEPGYYVSPDPEWPRPLVEIQAHVVDALLNERVLRPLGGLPTMLLLVAVCLLTLWLFPRLGVLFASAATAAHMLLWALLATLLIFAAGLWLPLVEILLAQATMLALVVSAIVRREERTLGEILHDLGTRLESRLRPTLSRSEQERWSAISSLTRQLLTLNRQMFLVPVSASHLRAVHADNCRFEQIVEPRRDYRRAPYSEALEVGGLYAVQREFLPREPDDVQYLLPLEFAGQLRGYWMFSVPESVAAQTTLLATTAEELARRLSEYLYHAAPAPPRGLGPWLARLFDPRSTRAIYQRLRESLLSMDQRMQLRDRASASLMSAYWVFDGFGHLQLLNRAAESLARKQEIPAFELDAHGLLQRLLGGRMELARQVLDRALIEQTASVLPLAPPGEVGLHVLHVTPLAGGAEREDRAEQAVLGGLLVEVIDHGDSWRLWQRNAELLSSLAQNVARHGERVLAQAQALPQDDGSREDLQILLPELRELALALKNESAVGEWSGGRLAPLDLGALLREVATERRHRLRRRALTLLLPRFAEPVFVLAEPALLTEGLGLLLDLLIDDAQDDSTIRVAPYCRLREQGMALGLCLDDEGVGMDPERLQEALQGVLHAGDDAALARLHTLRRQLERAEAELEAEAALGLGLRFDLSLRLMTTRLLEARFESWPEPD